MSQTSNPTLTAVIYKELMQDIATGQLQPGARLEEAELAMRYNVSRTPVREALRNLAVTGVVEVRPRRGAIVMDVSFQKLNNMLEVVADLEASSARYAAQRMSAEERLALRDWHLSMWKAVAGHDAAAFDLQNFELHRLVHEGSHNAVLRDQIAGMRLRTLPYLPLELAPPDRRAETSYEEHTAFVNAILAGEAELAYYAMRAHVTAAGLVAGDQRLDEIEPGSL
jgi:DNA-binding GntR family transcriptional regulator